MVSRRLIDHINLYALFAEFFSDAFADTVRAAGYYGYFLCVVHSLASSI